MALEVKEVPIITSKGVDFCVALFIDGKKIEERCFETKEEKDEFIENLLKKGKRSDNGNKK